LVLKAGSSFLGVRTNNQAEYEALIAALEFAVSAGAECVVCHLDSELVGRQLKKEYRVKSPGLRLLYLKAEALLQKFKKCTIINVPRTNIYIQKADALVNLVLDDAAVKA
jgi:ribonuclease HI